MYAADLDGDGDADVLSASSVDNRIAWYENDLQGSGSFQTGKTITQNADSATSVYATDLGGDGDADVLSASSGDDKIAWYENQCSDPDGDGVCDSVDDCPNDASGDTDRDGDGVCDAMDDCPNNASVDTDSDGDGTCDATDDCEQDPNKTSPGTCGCGTADTDSDGDRTPDCNDDCPQDPDKTEPGACGCGSDDADADGDGTADCEDECSEDADKTEPRRCGCGTADTDSDGDGTPDCNDECPDEEGTPSDGCPTGSSEDTGVGVDTGVGGGSDDGSSDEQVQAEDDSGCGCAQDGSAPPATGWLAVALLAAGWFRRR